MSFYQISVCATRALVGLVLFVACASLGISQVNIQTPPAPYGADDRTFGASKGSRGTQALR
ncbi:MAG TPA: hypothetical protein VFS20_30195, partial [Longimicrobium sp.]|nr:hypothetical protein [Longimicrobium sp.]